RISPFDRGFLYGDGIYEMLACRPGRLFRCNDHPERLEPSPAAVRMDNPCARAAWRASLQELVAANGGGDMNVYLQVTRGTLPQRDHRFPAGARSTVFAMCQPATVIPAAWHERGIAVITHADLRWLRCDVKTTSLIANVLL